MVAPAFVAPQEFVDGQVLGRTQLGVLLDNQRYFHGLCDRWRVPSHSVERDSTVTDVIWDGFLLLDADAKTMWYHIEADTDAIVDLYYDKGGAGEVLIATANNANPVREGSYDLSGFSPGLYRVYCRNRGTTGTTGGCHAPATTYTGSLSYTTPPTYTDGNVGTHTDLNKNRANGFYFNDIKPPQAAFVGCERGFVGTETSLVIWRGWIKHRHERIRYYVDLQPTDSLLNDNNNRIRIVYGYEDALAETVLQTAVVGEHESYHDLVNVFVDDTWYQIAVIIDRDDGNDYGQDSKLNYILGSPVAADASFTNVDALTVGQYIYGSTAGQDTRLQLVSDNDANINGRLEYHRFGVRKAEYTDLGGSGGTWHYRLMRRYDTLYYRGTSVTLRYGDDESRALDDVSSSYGTFNLQQLPGLQYGMIYRLEGSTLDFAMEA